MKMSKMKMPEMSVVRFAESDMIVASTRVYLQGWSDDTGLNGTARNEKNGTILASNRDSSIVTYFGGNVTFYPAAGRPFALDTMQNMDSNGEAINDFDGYYWYNDKTNVWERQ